MPEDLSNGKATSLAQMADFATWGYKLWKLLAVQVGVSATPKNIAGAVEEAVTSDIIGAAVIEFMTDKDEWKGTATDLIEKLNSYLAEKRIKHGRRDQTP